MSLRERARPGLGIIEPRHLPAPAGYTKSNMTASAFSRRDSAEPHAVIDLDQIPGAAEWARVVLSGAVGYGPYASFFVWFLFWYGCGAHRHCGVADRLTQHFNDRKRASLSRPATARTVTVELQRHSPVAKEASPAKDVSPVVSTAKADTKQIKHYKPRVLARQRNNYGYGNARGYASGYGPSSLFFR